MKEMKAFSVKDTTKVMEQITETTNVFKSSSMFGKIRREDESPSFRCYGCGQYRNIARDNPSCYRKIKKNVEEYQKRRASQGRRQKYKKTKNNEGTIIEYLQPRIERL